MKSKINYLVVFKVNPSSKKTFYEGFGLKRQSHLYSVAWNFSCVILYLSDSTLRISTLCTVLVFRVFSVINVFGFATCNLVDNKLIIS